MSFVLQTPTMKIFLGGDSGFDKHFEEIGNKFGPFDLAILENGQYDLNWRYIHLLPNEILRAARALKAKWSLSPVRAAGLVKRAAARAGMLWRFRLFGLCVAAWGGSNINLTL